VLTLLVVIVFQLGLLPNSDVESGLSAGPLGALALPFGGMALVGGGAALQAGRRLRAKSGAYQLGFFGFEVPLVLALAFGLVMWFGMRQAVIVSANGVDTPGSVTPFDRAVGLFPDLSMAHYLRGERHLSIHDLEGALRDFDKAVELDPDFPATYLARGRVMIELSALRESEDEQNDLLERALADGDKLVELKPEHPGGYAIRAWAKARLGDLAGASADIAEATKPLPEDARAWDAYFVRCLALAAVERLDEAEADCKQVLELNPGHIVSLDELAYISFIHAANELDDAKAQEYYQQGIDYTTQELEVDPNNAVAWTNRGEAYSNIDEFELAEEDLSRAIALDPTYARAYWVRGFVRLVLERPDEATADVDRAVEIYEQAPARFRLRPGNDVSTLLGTHLFVTFYAGETQAAADEATQLIAQGNDTAWVVTMRALARLELGQVQEGLADANRALEIDGGFTLALERRGYAYLLLGDLDRAQTDLDNAATRAATLAKQEESELHYHRALLYRARGQFADARAEAAAAINLVEIPTTRRQIEELQAELPAAP
jgi:tetratricopeptide (TPR) repeat protein